MSSKESCSKVLRTVTLAAVLLGVTALSGLARADVRFEGDWKDDDRLVTLDTGATPRAHAIELLAEAAGLSVVVSAPLTDPVEVHVKDQPARAVLALLLPDGSFIARRTGSLVSIQPAFAPAPSAIPPAPSATPTTAAAAETERGEDRTVFGGTLVVKKDEVVHDVAVFGGSLDVYGTVTGNLAVLGGSAHVHAGARVRGSATVLGGQMRVDDGAEVEHDVGVVGGHLDRGPHARVRELSTDDRKVEGAGLSTAGRAWRAISRWGDDALSSLSASALLFVLGVLVLALATDRSRALRVEVAARPMRTLALGVVGCLVAIAVSIALCVTLVGIPVALVGAVAFVLAAYAGVTAVLTTAGEALLRHRTENPYVHLGLGCALYFLVGLIPWVGGWAVFGVFLAGVGVMVATRAAGVFPARPTRLPPGQGFATSVG